MALVPKPLSQMSGDQPPTLPIVIADVCRHDGHLAEVVMVHDTVDPLPSGFAFFAVVGTTSKLLARRTVTAQDPPDLLDLLTLRENRAHHVLEAVRTPIVIEKRGSRRTLHDRRTKVPRSSVDSIAPLLEVVRVGVIAPPLLPDHDYIVSLTRENEDLLSELTPPPGRVEILEDLRKGVNVVDLRLTRSQTVRENVTVRLRYPVIVDMDQDILHPLDKKSVLRCPVPNWTPRLPSGRGMSMTSMLMKSTLTELFDGSMLIFVLNVRLCPNMMSIEDAKYLWALVPWLKLPL